MDKISATNIQDIFIVKPKIIETDGGCVLKMLLPDSPLLPDFTKGFGELYFSEIAPGAVRAWKRHARQSQLLAAPMGKIALGLFDGRRQSSTYGKYLALVMGRPDDYQIINIPPGIWYGFAGFSSSPALICNLASLPHDPQEISRAPAEGPEAPISWRKILACLPRANFGNPICENVPENK